MHIPDLDFVWLPEISVGQGTLPRRALPHLYVGDGICYREATTAVLDRYNPAGTILWCLKRAEEVLANSLSGASDQDFAIEFGAYWQGTVYVDLPPGFKKPYAALYWLALREDAPELRTGVIAEKGHVAQALLARHGRMAGKEKLTPDPCAVVQIDGQLTLTPDNWPPSPLTVFIRWLGHFVPDAEAIVRAALGVDANRKILVLRAANGCFVAEFIVPKAYKRPEFMSSRKHSLPKVMMAVADQVSVERFSGFRIDADYVYGRNMHGMRNLSGKKIAVVGCGTIGGFLAHALAQSGAGSGKGALHLFDKDTLQTPNLGRHILGIPQLGKPKAEGLCLFLVEQLPHIDVRAYVGDALLQEERLLKCDLVIDATGEEALSIALNHKFVRSRPNSPPILFVWLVGNGAGARAIMCVEPDLACLKCLKPALAGEERFRMLKEDPLTVRNLACGDATYVPFPVSRSMQAAALAVEMALDWANGRVRPYFRNRTLDERKAFHAKDQSPEASPHCPACRAG